MTKSKLRFLLSYVLLWFSPTYSVCAQRSEEMDWRAASRSRSRVSVMDWRPQSRSRSRNPFARTLQEQASEAHAQSLLEQGEYLKEQEQREAQQLSQFINSFPGDEGQLFTSQASLQHEGASLSSSFHQGPGSGPGSLSGSGILARAGTDSLSGSGHLAHSLPTIEYDQAVRAAAAYDLYASNMTGKKPRENHPDLSMTTALGGPASKESRPSHNASVPGIAGPNLVAESEENFHPQYGYLPRRVRKTSFDHTVGVPIEHGKGMAPPPKAAKVCPNAKKSCLIDTDHDNLPQQRKRPADASPQIDGRALAQSNLSVDALPPLEIPTAASVHITPGSFPNTAFTFTYPPNYDNFFDLAGASANTPANAATMSPIDGVAQLDDSTRDWMEAMAASQGQSSVGASPASNVNHQQSGFDLMHAANFAAMQAGVMPPGLEGISNYDFNQLMQQYLHSNAVAENGQVTINPSQVLGGVNQNGMQYSGHFSTFSSPAAESPQSMSINGHNSSKPLGPTRPLPKSVGGKQLTRDDTGRKVSNQLHQPMRSNSSPNLAGFSVRPMTNADKGSQNKTNGKQSKAVAIQSGPGTPTSDDGAGPGSVITGGETPTVCTNCHTTNTPLWRRDPDGQPLCNVSFWRGLCQA